MNKETKSPPECPECERMALVTKETQAAGEFLDWLLEEKGCSLEHRKEEVGSTLELLAEWKDIDLKKVEREKQALLDWLSKESEKPKNPLAAPPPPREN